MPLLISYHQNAVRCASESLRRVRIMQEQLLETGTCLNDHIARLEEEKTVLERRNSHLEEMQKSIICAANVKDDANKS